MSVLGLYSFEVDPGVVRDVLKPMLVLACSAKARFQTVRSIEAQLLPGSDAAIC